MSVFGAGGHAAAIMARAPSGTRLRSTAGLEQVLHIGYEVALQARSILPGFDGQSAILSRRMQGAA